jgi:hypothetical protein
MSSGKGDSEEAERVVDDPYEYIEWRARVEGLDAAELVGGREVPSE